MSEGATVSGISGILTRRGRSEDLPPIEEIPGEGYLEELEENNEKEPCRSLDSIGHESLMNSQDARQSAGLEGAPTRMINDDQLTSTNKIFSLERIRNAAANFKGGKDSERDEAIAGLIDCVNQLSTRLDAQRDSINDYKNKKLGGLCGRGIRLRIQPPKFPLKPLHSLGNVNSIRLVEGAFPRTKFTGSKKDTLSIREFLEAMNRGQVTCQLSEKDFKAALIQRCLGEAYRMVSRWIDMEETVESIYFSLYNIYGNDLQPFEAQNRLISYQPPRYIKFDQIKAEIEELALTASMISQEPDDQKRLYNELALMALRKCLPTTSRRYVEEISARVAAAEGRPPTYNEVTEGLKNYLDAINEELRSPPPGYALAKPRKFLALTVKGSSGNEPEKPENYRANRTKGRGNGGQRRTFRANKIALEEASEDSEEEQEDEAYAQVNELNTQSQSRKMGQKTPTGRYEQAKKKQGQYSRNSGQHNTHQNNRIGQGKKFCMMCLSNTHNPSDNCFALKDDRGKQIEGGLSTGPCEICKDKLKKDLFHNSKYCPLRPKMLQLYAEKRVKPIGIFARYLHNKGQKDTGNKSHGRQA